MWKLNVSIQVLDVIQKGLKIKEYEDRIQVHNIPSSMCSKASVYKRQSSSNAFFWVDAFMKWQVNPASCCKYCSNNWGCKFVKMEAGKKSMTLRMILEMPKASLAWNIENIFHQIKPYKSMLKYERMHASRLDLSFDAAKRHQRHLGFKK